MEKEKIDVLNNISPSFCAAKWIQTTLYLQNGFNHSCHHPNPHKIPLEELKENYKALHNTKFKKEQMQKMLDGIRPSECEYCWKVEDMGNISDRFYKSIEPWAWPFIPKILATKTQDINPTYLEISFSNVCNFKCAYCSPDVSSKWAEETKQFGPYPTSHATGKLKPTYNHNEYNPYVEAFWEWWPELSKNLTNLRLTGGEPLLSKDVWDLLDKLEKDPDLNPKLILGINTNLNVPKNLIDKLIAYINRIAPRIKEVNIFTSGEAVNEQAEYIRYGLNYKEWYENLDNLLTNVPSNSWVGIMTTINILSLGTIDKFYEDIMKLRIKHHTSYEHNKLIISTNYLRYPPFLHPCLAPVDVKEQTIERLEKLIDRWKEAVYPSEGHYALLYESDQEKIRMICNLLRTHSISDEKLNTDQKDFYLFVQEYDRRRNTEFDKIFPELVNFKNYCKELFNN